MFPDGICRVTGSYYTKTIITTAVVVDLDGTIRHVPTKIIEKNGNTMHQQSDEQHPVEFSDVENHWAKDVINDLGPRMVVYGDENGNYNPDNDITRAICHDRYEGTWPCSQSSAAASASSPYNSKTPTA